MGLVENVNNCSQKNVTMSIKSKIIKFLCFFVICNFTPLMFFINSPHKSHGTEFACLLSAGGRNVEFSPKCRKTEYRHDKI
ncbi:hypothetical protein BpHYR1_050282 [Brachionus plicatilis]|uniref:Uncharacterized protein n=1 Tax=Brachionus plicatilis TaxID=10195 RepID=A0A3M7QS95_BRAPC|nr:hypothetical protein BpHYR1_050282 [Brachionus plicatilis]